MAGDTHGTQEHCRYLIRTAKAEYCDRVFVLGDWGYWEHQQEGIRFCDKLNRYCEELGIPMYFLDGNHDKTSLLLEKYGDQPDEEGFLQVRPMLRYAGRGHRWTWDGIRFISLGGAYSVDKGWRLQSEASRGKPGTLWFPEEEMSDEDMALILKNTDEVDVMLAHDKPRGSNPRWNRKDYQECLPNQDRLQLAIRTLTPRWFWHGHLHFWYRDSVDYSNLQGEHRVVQVQGLNCDNEAGQNYHDPNGEFTVYYNKAQSWEVLDTDALLVEMLT